MHVTAQLQTRFGAERQTIAAHLLFLQSRDACMRIVQLILADSTALQQHFAACPGMTGKMLEEHGYHMQWWSVWNAATLEIQQNWNALVQIEEYARLRPNH